MVVLELLEGIFELVISVIAVALVVGFLLLMLYPIILVFSLVF